MAVALITEPSGAMLPTGKTTVLPRPFCARGVGAHDHAVRIDAVGLLQAGARRAPALAAFPPVEDRAERLAGDGEDVEMEQTHPAQVEHHFGHAARHEHLHGRMIARAVGQGVHEARRHAG